jgi:hypothetical protein
MTTVKYIKNIYKTGSDCRRLRLLQVSYDSFKQKLFRKYSRGFFFRTSNSLRESTVYDPFLGLPFLPLVAGIRFMSTYFDSFVGLYYFWPSSSLLVSSRLYLSLSVRLDWFMSIIYFSYFLCLSYYYLFCISCYCFYFIILSAFS